MSEEKWGQTNVNVGFLVAIILGIAAVVGAAEGFRAWIDSRIGVVVDPLVVRIDQIQERLDSDDRRRNQQYGQLRSDICLVLQSLDEPCPQGISATGDGA